MGKRILIAPLDWGLGHATRCIPIIRFLLETGNNPIIATADRPYELLKAEFPNAEFIQLRGYDISYPEGSGMAWKMFKLIPHILGRISWENKELQKLVERHKLDAVISDNRFGLYTDKVPCVYITHQVMIKAPFFEPLLHRLHKGYMDRFTETWVPDHAENGLSGDLAHKFPLPSNGKFIGSLTRFHKKKVQQKRDVLVLISGPEPQRTRFEQMVLSQMEAFDGSAMAVLGTPEMNTDQKNSRSHRIVTHLSAEEMENAIAESGLIISRSGYSTIMDLEVLGKKAVFVPTPGQTEQEYLGKKYMADKTHMMMTQKKFDLQKAWSSSGNYTGFKSGGSEGYKQAIEELLNSLS